MKTFGQHGLTLSVWSTHHEIVASSCSDLHGVLRMILSLHIAIIIILHRARGKEPVPVCVSRVQRNCAVKKCHSLKKRVKWISRHALHHGRFLPISAGKSRLWFGRQAIAMDKAPEIGLMCHPAKVRRHRRGLYILWRNHFFRDENPNGNSQVAPDPSFLIPAGARFTVIFFAEK